MIRVLACLFVAYAAPGFDATMILLPAGGTNRQPVNAAYVSSNTIGRMPDSWTLTGAAGALDTNYVLSIPVQAVVGGTNYFGRTSYAMRISHATEQQFRIAWPSAQRTNSLTFGLMMKNTSNGVGRRDVVSTVAGDGDSATLQLMNGAYVPHTDFPDGAGAAIDIDHTVWHWFEGTFRQHGGDMDVAIYTTNGLLVGTSEWPITSDSAGFTSFNFGNVNSHSRTDGDILYGPIVLVARGSNDVLFPLGVSAITNSPSEVRPPFRSRGRSPLRGIRFRR